MRWLGFAIADAVSLKRRQLVYDQETDHWCVDTDRQKTGNPVYVPIPFEVYEELVASARARISSGILFL